jgi:dihydroorotase
MTYDVLLKGGHVIDPANGVNKVLDVAVKDGKIAAVAENIPSAQGRKAVVVDGHYVTPGLIDIHVHVYGGYRGWMFPDVHAFTNGVTTVVDTGGAGWKSFEDFKRTIIDPSRARVLAFLNIVGAGMLGAVEQDVSEMDPIPCAEMIQKYSDVIVGSKTAHFDGPGWEAVDGAVKAAELSGTITMIDFWPKPTRSYQELILERMRPGDIHTHVYAKHIPVLDSQKRVCDHMFEARERGVIFDLGHGAGSFWWRVAIPAIQQGFLPDTISTDLHKSSALIPNATMITTMSKCLNMGLSLPDVIARATVHPARVIRRPELGTLSIGSVADVAVIQLQRGQFGFVDSGHARLKGNQKLECAMTIRAGEIVWDRNGLSWPDWDAAGEYGVIV